MVEELDTYDTFKMETARLRRSVFMKASLAPKPKGPAPKPVVEAKVTAPDGVVAGICDATMALRSNQCRWPFGDTQDPQFYYCPSNALKTKRYCETHGNISRKQGVP